MSYNDLTHQTKNLEVLNTYWKSSEGTKDRRYIRMYILGPMGLQSIVNTFSEHGLYLEYTPINPESTDTDIEQTIKSVFEQCQMITSFEWLRLQK